MGELQAEFSPLWVRTFAGPIDTATLTSAIAWASEPRPSTCPMPPKFDWQHVGAETAAFYRRVIAGPAAYRATETVPARDRSL
jgi:hypothetical protein